MKAYPPDTIDRFGTPKEPSPLSNFYSSTFVAVPYRFPNHEPLEWPTVEHYFQASKAVPPTA